jgi:hypothetical protein
LSSLATKWNLKFNSNKSKVLVVGKYIDKSNKWVVGDTYIEETNEYKYNVPWSIFGLHIITRL